MEPACDLVGIDEGKLEGLKVVLEKGRLSSTVRSREIDENRLGLGEGSTNRRPDIADHRALLLGSLFAGTKRRPSRRPGVRVPSGSTCTIMPGCSGSVA